MRSISNAREIMRSKRAFILRLRIDIEDPELTMIERSRTHLMDITLYEHKIREQKLSRDNGRIYIALEEADISSAHSSDG